MPDVKEQVNLVGLTLKERGLLFDHVNVEEGNKPIIRLSFGGGDFSYANITLNVLFDDDGKSVQIRTAPIARVPEERKGKLLETINSCNSRFRWVRFYIDDEGLIVADNDVAFDERNAGTVVVEVIQLMASILDDVYSDIMKSIWE